MTKGENEMDTSSDYKDLCVIIRSTGERTEGICKYSIMRDDVSDNQIHFIRNIRPFSKCLKTGYELAIDLNKKYTCFIDADCIMLPNALSLIINLMSILPKNSFVMTTLMYDYLTGRIVPGGPHLYRTEYLREAVMLIPNENISLRPESSTLKKMHQKGFESIYLEFPAAVHSLGQYYRDIFRAAMNKRYKTSGINLLKRFELLKSTNKDFEIAYLAVSDSMKNNTKLKLDYQQFVDEFNNYGIAEKDDIDDVETAYNSLLSDFDKDSYELYGYTNIFLKRLANKNENRFFTYLTNVAVKLMEIFYKRGR